MLKSKQRKWDVMYWIKILLLVLLPSVLSTQVVKTTKTFNAQGKPHSKVANKTRVPKTVIDTVRMVNGYGTLTLNSNFKRGRHNVSATSNNFMYAIITSVLTDTTGTPYYYSYVRDKKGKKLTIKSSGGASDDGLVVVQLYVK